MADLFQDTIVGQAIYLASGRKIFNYVEDRQEFVPPPRFMPGAAERLQDEKRARTNSGGSPRGFADRKTVPPVDAEASGLTGEKPQEDLSQGPDPVRSDDSAADEERTLASPNQKERGEAYKEAEQEPGGADQHDKEDDPYLVDWYGPDDTLNPLNWSNFKKAFVTFGLCILTFGVYSGSSIYTPGEMDFAMEMGIGQVPATLGLTLFVIGYGVGPMFLSPLSEIPSIGRNLPYLTTLAIFVILQVPTVLVHNVAGFMILRFLAGFFGSPALATAGASIADMYSPKKRAYAIGVWGLAAVCGPVLGPLIGGFSSVNGWRWTIWPLLWLSGGVLLFLLFTLPETSATNILVRRAQRLRRVTGNDKLHSQGEVIQAQMTGQEIVMMTLVRPFTLTFREPIVFCLNLYIALVYAILYVWFEAFPLVFAGIYGFTPGEQGLAFMGIFVGAVLTYLGFCVYARVHLEPLFDRKGGMIDPENRLPPAIFGSFFIPICMFWFGWTSTTSIHWIVPIIGSSFFSVGTFLLFQSVLNYLPDAYPVYAASVLAGNDFFRASLGGAFPLFARAMFTNLQKNGPSAFPVAWGCTLLGCISIVMIPFPYIFWAYGAKIRSWSKYATSNKAT